MDKVYQVFVSSTYSDLRDERRRVSETLAKAGYIPAGMELFPATDQQQLEFIKRIIDRCDYYVVIIGGRYGSLADESISFTEKEYEYALERNIPVLAFVHSNPDDIPSGKTDKDLDKIKKLDAFRTRLATGRMIDFWSETNDLCTKIVIAVGQAITLKPGVGWVRGDQAIDPKVFQDLERLRGENELLKQKLATLNEDEIKFPAELAGPDEQITLDITVEDFQDDGGGGVAKKGTFSVSVKRTIASIFASTYDVILKEPSERTIGEAIGKALCSELEGDSTYRRASISTAAVEKLRNHLEALGLVRAVGKYTVSHRGGFEHRNDYIAWTVTDKARRYVTRMRAIQRTAALPST